MPVIIRYVVERNGEEKMTFTTKKEADAYDKELDIAEQIESLLSQANLEIDAEVIGELSLYLARERDQLSRLLKGKSLSEPTKDSDKPKSKTDKKKKTVGG